MPQYSKEVIITEVSFRDGFQSAPEVYLAEDKVRLMDMMADAGCRSMEVGAFSNYPSMAKMRKTNEVFKLLEQRPGIEYRALIFDPDGAKEAADCGCKKVKLNISASLAHHTSGTGMTPLEAMGKFADVAKVASDSKLELMGSISLPFGSPFPGEGIVPYDELSAIIARYIEVGVTEISLTDAAGLGTPKLIYERSASLGKKFPQVKWVLHMHNTYGMGLAGIAAAMQAGIAKFDTSLAGLGGCPYMAGATGNVATEDLIYMLDGMDISTGIDLEKAIEVGAVIRKMVGDRGIDCYQQRLADVRKSKGSGMKW